MIGHRVNKNGPTPIPLVGKVVSTVLILLETAGRNGAVGPFVFVGVEADNDNGPGAQVAKDFHYTAVLTFIVLMLVLVALNYDGVSHKVNKDVGASTGTSAVDFLVESWWVVGELVAKVFQKKGSHMVLLEEETALYTGVVGVKDAETMVAVGEVSGTPFYVDMSAVLAHILG